MKIHRQGVHHDDLIRFGTYQRSRLLGQEAVVRDPRPPRMKVTLDAELCPCGEFLLDIVAYSFGLQSKRMPAQVDATFTVLSTRKVELFPIPRQRIAIIHGDREIFGSFLLMSHHEISPSGGSSLPMSCSALVQSRSSTR